jgi:hypothetical protein
MMCIGGTYSAGMFIGTVGTVFLTRRFVSVFFVPFSYRHFADTS